MKVARKPIQYTPKLFLRLEAISYLGMSERDFDDERTATRFPPPARKGKWTQPQLDDYLSQLETYGDWCRDRYTEAMTARRKSLFLKI